MNSSLKCLWDMILQLKKGGIAFWRSKQRIAIARALIINPKILILDEATSALDYESERLIYETLRKLKRKLTILFISHRLSFMKECDLILVIDKGRLIEIGTHEFLMKNKGLYAYLYKQQESV